MIIKEIRIKNFRSYYGDTNVFEFSDGLTLILGDNGDGKTTFFEALEWLFNTSYDKGNMDHVSEMRKSKLEIGEEDEVMVSIKFDHDGEKMVEKSFSFERTAEKSFRANKVSYRGYETRGAQRVMTDGKALINRCYETFIQKFSMFKGESDLNVFDNATTLKTLVDKFSEISAYDKLVDNAEEFAHKADIQYKKEAKSDDRIADETYEIERKMDKVSSDIVDKRAAISEKKASLETYTKRLKELEDNQETSEKYHDIKERLKTQEEKLNKLRSMIGAVDYSHALLDKKWILCAFPQIFAEFKAKCAALSKEKRRQDKEFDRQQAIEMGKLEAIKEIQGTLINGATELPWYLPNQETMEEMIHDHICKVCGREAPEGSEAYNFMVNKLEQYKEHVASKLKKDAAKKELEEQALFKKRHIEELHTLSIQLSGNKEEEVARIAEDIRDRMELVDRLQQDKAELEKKIADIKDDKTRLLIQAGNVSEEALEADFKNVKGLFEHRGNAETRLAELNTELKFLLEEQKELKRQLSELNPANSQVKVMKEVQSVLEHIADAFANAKEENLRRFLAELEEQSNHYLSKLSANDFHGEIRLVQTAENSTEIHLFSSNNTEIKKPSGSQKTVMYISVLFAISDFTKQKRDEDYPLIFDAATSSFGDSKEEGFYNVIDGIQKQCIIVTKDFIEKGKVREKDIARLSCPVYRIKKAEGFNQKNMATIRTIIEKIKD